MEKIHEQNSFSTSEIQTIANSLEEDFGKQGAFPKEHPKSCCCCTGSAAVVLPESE